MEKTILEKASVIYRTVLNVVDYDRTSDCITPLELARQQVAALPKEGRFCVPGAGFGTYIYALIEHGVKPENIWAVELSPKYADFGALMFTRLGVSYVEADFLTWEPGVKFDAIVGNPPYGKNTSLAVKFLNKAIELTDNVHYVLPRSFRKPSILNRVHPNLHLVEDLDVADETFGGTIITCCQRWELREEKREKVKTSTKHPDFAFVGKDEANLFVGRMGHVSGRVLTEDFVRYAENHFFLKVEDEEVKQRLITLSPKFHAQARAAVVGIPNLSKNEMIAIYMEEFGA